MRRRIFFTCKECLKLVTNEKTFKLFDGQYQDTCYKCFVKKKEKAIEIIKPELREVFSSELFRQVSNYQKLKALEK
jgi:Zn-finger protein